MNNLDKFMEVYTKKLIEARTKHPLDYAWPEGELINVLRRMKDAIESGSFNKDSHAFKNTCKELGIKHTYSAIKQYLNS